MKVWPIMLAGNRAFLWIEGIGGDCSSDNSEVVHVNANAGITWDMEIANQISLE